MKDLFFKLELHNYTVLLEKDLASYWGHLKVLKDTKLILNDQGQGGRQLDK